MNTRVSAAIACMLAIAACGEPPPPAADAPAFTIDRSRITVSGVSSGAYMAGQYHVAHSSEVSGVGLIAGGPYRCANGSMNQGLGPCMNGGDMDIPALVEYANAEAAEGSIDELENLRGDRIWLFHGANDTIIHADVPAAAAEFYREATDEIEIAMVTDVSAPHGMPTVASDGACDEVVTPFLNNCGYDAAGELLNSISDISKPRSEQPDGELIAVAQTGASDAEMLEEAMLFVPTACAQGESCGLHIAFHGCQQSTEFVGAAFAAESGFNEWAATNNLLVLYPQVAKSSVAPLNPLGCWDWWGYTGEGYATRNGAQISVVKALVDTLGGAPD